MGDNDYATIRASGPDAAEFLQGQLTNDIGLLERQASMLAAWCTPKGRVIAILEVRKDADDYLLTLPGELADDVVKRLTMFRFRAKLDLDIEAGGAPPDVEGLPFIGRAQTEKFTPHMLNLDLLDAVSLDKGCYTGQEIVARTHYRGATRRRTLRFEASGPVAVGDKVSDGDRDIGDVINVNGSEILAVMPVEKADESIEVNGAALTPSPLPYL